MKISEAGGPEGAHPVFIKCERAICSYNLCKVGGYRVFNLRLELAGCTIPLHDVIFSQWRQSISATRIGVSDLPVVLEVSRVLLWMRFWLAYGFLYSDRVCSTLQHKFCGGDDAE